MTSILAVNLAARKEIFIYNGFWVDRAYGELSYTAKAGDTWGGILEKAGRLNSRVAALIKDGQLTADVLKDYNDAENETPKAGQEICLPLTDRQIKFEKKVDRMQQGANVQAYSVRNGEAEEIAKEIRPLLDDAAATLEKAYKQEKFESLKPRIESFLADPQKLALSDQAKDEMIGLIEELGRLDIDAAVDYLIELYQKTDNYDVANGVVNVLNESRSLKVRDFYMKLLTEAEVSGDFSRSQAIDAINGLRNFPGLMTVQFLEKIAAREPLSSAGKTPLVNYELPISTYVKSGEKSAPISLQWYVLDSLESIFGMAADSLKPRIKSVFYEVLSGGNETAVREAAVKILGRIGDRSDVGPLSDFSWSDPIREAAKKAVEEIKARQAK